MKLFDAKYVHFMYDESLVGKRGFFSDNLTSLRMYVQSQNRIGEVVDRSKHSTAEFLGDDGVEWKFFYYDPLYAYKWAYDRGGEVQMRYKGTHTWANVTDECIWSEEYEYRISERMTWQGLAEWLGKGNGQARSPHGSVLGAVSYSEDKEQDFLPEGWKIRPWGRADWQEPARTW